MAFRKTSARPTPRHATANTSRLGRKLVITRRPRNARQPPSELPGPEYIFGAEISVGPLHCAAAAITLMMRDRNQRLLEHGAERLLSYVTIRTPSA